MSKPLISHHRFLPYLIPVLHLGLAFGLLIHQQIFFATGALLLGCMSLCSNLYLWRLVETANRQKFSLDQQLIQAQKLASIGELSSGIAHEINNPLAIIGQEAEWIRHLMKSAGDDNKEWILDLKESLKEIVRQVVRCKDITHKLLGFARKSEPLMQRTEINKLLEDMVKLVEREAAQRGISLVRDYDPNLTAVLTDPPLVRQVALNLLNNSVYAVGENGKITITTHNEQNAWVVFDIRDTGSGITKEHLSKVFDPFFTTKSQGKGTGLGLSICHGIVTKLGGCIRVESKPGEGTVFSVRLPLKCGKEGA